MDNLNPEFSQPFMFKLPIGPTENIGVDLKWLGEEFEHTTDLFNQFSESYKKLVAEQKHPTPLLKAQFKVIEALANYQIALIEQQGKRQGHIQSESDLQEMMNQLDQFTKMFRENK